MRAFNISRIPWRDWGKKAVIQMVRFIVAGIIMGWLYVAAAPWFYPKSGSSGFIRGVLHGGIMPMALPSLLLGNDVDIYAVVNTGRSYKVGYICGINLCGLIFFGMAFAKPKKKEPPPLDLKKVVE